MNPEMKKNDENGELDTSMYFIAIEGGDLSSSVALNATPLEKRFARQGVNHGVTVNYKEGQENIPVEQKVIDTIHISPEALKAFIEQTAGGGKFEDSNDAVQVISLIRSHVAANGSAFGALERVLTMAQSEKSELSEKTKGVLASQLTKALVRLPNLVRIVGTLSIAAQAVTKESKAKFNYEGEHDDRNALDELADVTETLANNMAKLLELVKEVKKFIGDDREQVGKVEVYTTQLTKILTSLEQKLRAA